MRSEVAVACYSLAIPTIITAWPRQAFPDPGCKLTARLWPRTHQQRAASAPCCHAAWPRRPTSRPGKARWGWWALGSQRLRISGTRDQYMREDGMARHESQLRLVKGWPAHSLPTRACYRAHTRTYSRIREGGLYGASPALRLCTSAVRERGTCLELLDGAVLLLCIVHSTA